MLAAFAAAKRRSLNGRRQSLTREAVCIASVCRRALPEGPDDPFRWHTNKTDDIALKLFDLVAGAYGEESRAQVRASRTIVLHSRRALGSELLSKKGCVVQGTEERHHDNDDRTSAELQGRPADIPPTCF